MNIILPAIPGGHQINPLDAAQDALLNHEPGTPEYDRIAADIRLMQKEGAWTTNGIHKLTPEELTAVSNAVTAINTQLNQQCNE